MYITSVFCNRRFNITGWCVQRQMRACALHLFWNCAICEIHSSTKSLLITSVEGCGAGLWAGTWVIRPSVWELEFRIWSLDWANWLFLYTLKTNKNFLNQSHSRDRVVWTKRGTGGEPPPQWLFSGFSAISGIVCYDVNLSFSHRPGVPPSQKWPSDSTQNILVSVPEQAGVH